MNICPVYARIGGHAYGWVYPGPIGAVVSPMLVGLKQAKELPQASSLCGACREVCPIKIDIPRMLLDLRKKTAESPDLNIRSAPKSERILASLFSSLMSSPRLLSTAVGFANLVQKTERILPFSPLTKDRKWIRHSLFPPLSKWTRSRDLPALPKQTFRDIWKKELSRDDS